MTSVQVRGDSSLAVSRLVLRGLAKVSSLRVSCTAATPGLGTNTSLAAETSLHLQCELTSRVWVSGRGQWALVVGSVIVKMLPA